MQSKLQSLKQEKNRSQQWISEVKSHPDWKEFKPKNKEDQIGNLVLVAYLFAVRPGQSSEEVYGRLSNLCSVLLSTEFGLSSYPQPSEVSKYPTVLACVCGSIKDIDGFTGGLLRHCNICEGKKLPFFFVDMFQDGIARSGCASRHWAEWAQLQAIVLRHKAVNRRTHTAIVSLSSEKEDDRTP